jgi:hypothetical protein
VIETVGGETRPERQLDGARAPSTCGENLHDETLLVVYLPKQKLLVQADAFHPRPGAKPLAAPPPFTVNLVENIRRLKLDVERVVAPAWRDRRDGDIDSRGRSLDPRR